MFDYLISFENPFYISCILQEFQSGERGSREAAEKSSRSANENAAAESAHEIELRATPTKQVTHLSSD